MNQQISIAKGRKYHRLFKKIKGWRNINGENNILSTWTEYTVAQLKIKDRMQILKKFEQSRHK